MDKLIRLKWLALIIVLLWLCIHSAHPINLISVDLGRHIKNGDLILHGHWEVLYKNYYSYTNPEYPFVNHHWFFGVFCYVLSHYLGFVGLTVIYLIIEILTFYLFLSCTKRYASFTLICAFALLSMPLIALRSDIRPEGITCLFFGLYWWLIDSFLLGKVKPKQLMIALCVSQIIWVNSHIFFILGPILTALFWWQARSNGQREQADVIQKLFLLLLVMCLINPSGLKGLLTPLSADSSYFEYPNLENFSVFFLLGDKTLPYRSILIYFLGAFMMLVVPLFFLIRREGLRKNIFILSLTLITSFAAMKVNRMIGIFGYCWLPLSIYVYSQWIKTASVRFRKIIEVSLLVLGIIASASVNFGWKQNHHLGIAPGSNNAAEFFKRERINGPIFNNYNIGSYLIFHFSPQLKFFMDARPEAYPANFMRRASMRWDDDAFHQWDQQYHFNAIFINPEHTYYGKRFLIRRFLDPAWAPVYVSDDVIIFLKRNAQNASIIKRNEMSQDKINIVF